jgi:hypothetical protein
MMSKDFQDILRAFNDHKVKYLVVGGYAFGVHLEPRTTKDIETALFFKWGSLPNGSTSFKGSTVCLSTMLGKTELKGQSTARYPLPSFRKKTSSGISWPAPEIRTFWM